MALQNSRMASGRPCRWAGNFAGSGSRPTQSRLLRIPAIARDAVHYHPLPGESLRQLLRAGMEPDERQNLRSAFTRFVIELHEKGIYFRSLHLGNVLHLPDGHFGLIDIADARLRPWRLSIHLRRRNLRLLLAAAGEGELIDAAAVLAGRGGVPS
jgi:hypothetical protein